MSSSNNYRYCCEQTDDSSNRWMSDEKCENVKLQCNLIVNENDCNEYGKYCRWSDKTNSCVNKINAAPFGKTITPCPTNFIPGMSQDGSGSHNIPVPMPPSSLSPTTPPSQSHPPGFIPGVPSPTPSRPPGFIPGVPSPTPSRPPGFIPGVPSPTPVQPAPPTSHNGLGWNDWNNGWDTNVWDQNGDWSGRASRSSSNWKNWVLGIIAALLVIMLLYLIFSGKNKDVLEIDIK
jgi:hypothetical protein